MTKRRKASFLFKRPVILLAVFFFFLMAVGVLVAAVQQRQDLLGWASSGSIWCQEVPAGNYYVKIKTHFPLEWEISCGKVSRSGKIPPTTIPFVYHKVPTIRKGDTYTLNTTLGDVCPSYQSKGRRNDVCEVCKYIDCSKITISGKLDVGKIYCLLSAYQVRGQGSIKITGSDLKGCTAEASYGGRLTGTFVPGVK